MTNLTGEKPMRRTLLAAAAFIALPIAAMAAPITGVIDFAGSNTYTGSTVTFAGSQDATSDTGTLGNFGTCTGCITALSFTYNPFAGPLAGFISGTNNGVTFSLDLDSVFNVMFQAGNSLDFDGAALLHETGFSNTAGELFFSTQGPGAPVQVSFSATAVPVPEPSTLAVLGAGLIGLAVWRYRKPLEDHAA